MTSQKALRIRALTRIDRLKSILALLKSRTNVTVYLRWGEFRSVSPEEKKCRIREYRNAVHEIRMLRDYLAGKLVPEKRKETEEELNNIHNQIKNLEKKGRAVTRRIAAIDLVRSALNKK